MQLLIQQEQQRRHHNHPDRTSRETRLWQMILENGINFYERELAWIKQLRADLGTL
jgi:hypothetical protein